MHLQSVTKIPMFTLKKNFNFVKCRKTSALLNFVVITSFDIFEDG